MDSIRYRVLLGELVEQRKRITAKEKIYEKARHAVEVEEAVLARKIATRKLAFDSYMGACEAYREISEKLKAYNENN